MAYGKRRCVTLLTSRSPTCFIYIPPTYIAFNSLLHVHFFLHLPPTYDATIRIYVDCMQTHSIMSVRNQKNITENNSPIHLSKINKHNEPLVILKAAKCEKYF